MYLCNMAQTVLKLSRGTIEFAVSAGVTVNVLFETSLSILPEVEQAHCCIIQQQIASTLHRQLTALSCSFFCCKNQLFPAACC